MKTLKFNRHKIQYYDSIHELPVLRYNKYNKNILIDSGVGSDLNAFDTRIQKIRRLVHVNQDQADTELLNLRQGVHLMISETSPEQNAFVSLVYSIDGRVLNDQEVLTEEGQKKTLQELTTKRFSIKHLKQVLDDVKKNFELEFEIFFHQLVDSPILKEVYQELKKRTVLVLRNIRRPSEQIQEQIRKIDDYLLTKIKPKKFTGKESYEVRMIKNFESTCTGLELNNLSSSPTELTTYTFFEKVEVLKDIIKQRQKASKRR